MAKKSRRVRRKGSQPRLSKAQLVKPTEIIAAETAPQPEKQEADKTAVISKEAHFGDEYRYVVKDLQRIFLLAGAMLAALVILSFVL